MKLRTVGASTIRCQRIIVMAASMIFLVSTAACNSSPVASPSSTTNTPTAATVPNTVYPMPPTTIPSRTRAGASPYGFTLLDSRRMTLSDYLGDVVVVDFWATWCPPCRQETPHLVDLQRRYGKQGLHVIGLNVGGPDDKSRVPEFVAQFKIPKEYTLGFPDPQMASVYLSDDDRIPQAFVFDRKGRLAKRFISYDETVPAEMERVVQAALAASAN